MANKNGNCCTRKEKKELEVFLMVNNYVLKRKKGSHMIYKNAINGNVKVITLHLNKMICQRIKKEILLEVNS